MPAYAQQPDFKTRDWHSEINQRNPGLVKKMDAGGYTFRVDPSSRTFSAYTDGRPDDQANVVLNVCGKDGKPLTARVKTSQGEEVRPIQVTVRMRNAGGNWVVSEVQGLDGASQYVDSYNARVEGAKNKKKEDEARIANYGQASDGFSILQKEIAKGKEPPLANTTDENFVDAWNSLTPKEKDKYKADEAKVKIAQERIIARKENAREEFKKTRLGTRNAVPGTTLDPIVETTVETIVSQGQQITDEQGKVVGYRMRKGNTAVEYRPDLDHTDRYWPGVPQDAYNGGTVRVYTINEPGFVDSTIDSVLGAIAFFGVVEARAKTLSLPPQEQPPPNSTLVSSSRIEPQTPI